MEKNTRWVSRYALYGHLAARVPVLIRWLKYLLFKLKGRGSQCCEALLQLSRLICLHDPDKVRDSLVACRDSLRPVHDLVASLANAQFGMTAHLVVKQWDACFQALSKIGKDTRIGEEGRTMLAKAREWWDQDASDKIAWTILRFLDPNQGHTVTKGGKQPQWESVVLTFPHFGVYGSAEEWEKYCTALSATELPASIRRFWENWDDQMFAGCVLDHLWISPSATSPDSVLSVADSTFSKRSGVQISKGNRARRMFHAANQDVRKTLKCHVTARYNFRSGFPGKATDMDDGDIAEEEVEIDLSESSVQSAADAREDVTSLLNDYIISVGEKYANGTTLADSE